MATSLDQSIQSDTAKPNIHPHDRKGGGLIVKILDFCEQTLFACLFEIVFSHTSLMVKLYVRRARHAERQESSTTLLNMLSRFKRPIQIHLQPGDISFHGLSDVYN